MRPECRRRCGTPSSRRASALSEQALEVLETVALALPRAEPWLLEAVLQRRHPPHRRVPRERARHGGRRRRRIPSRARPRGGRGCDAADTPARAAAPHPRGAHGDGAGEIDPARLAHHAEAAGDADAVLEFAPAAADRANSTGAYREAAAQYARALRVGGATLSAGATRASCSKDARAPATWRTTSSRRSTVVREAIASRREEGAPAREARDLTELSAYLFCRGLLGEARRRLRRGDPIDRRPGREQPRWRSSAHTGR